MFIQFNVIQRLRRCIKRKVLNKFLFVIFVIFLMTKVTGA